MEDHFATPQLVVLVVACALASVLPQALRLALLCVNLWQRVALLFSNLFCLSVCLSAQFSWRCSARSSVPLSACLSAFLSTGCFDRIGTRRFLVKKKCFYRIGTRANRFDRIGTHFYACIVV